MKKSLTLMLAATSAFFFACGDDGSSDNGTGSGSVTVEESGTIIVDTLKKTTIVVTEESEDACVNEGAGVYTWKTVDMGLDSSFSKYEFVGDTLVMYDCDYMDGEGDLGGCENAGQMMVGGDAPKLDGTWKAIFCMYDSEESETHCFKRCEDIPGGRLTEKEAAALNPQELDSSLIDRMNCLTQMELTQYGLDEETVKISGNSISAKVTLYYDDEEFDDYMNSMFMTSLYRSLTNGRAVIPSPDLLTVEDSSGVAEYLSLSNIEVTKQNKNSVTFKIADQTVSVSVDEYNLSERFEFAMTISVNGKSCALQEEEGEVSKRECNVEYEKFLEMSPYKDASGNEFVIAYEYEKSNEDEFEECSEALMDSLYASIMKNEGGSMGDDNCGNIIQEYYVCTAAGSISNCNYSGYQECLAALTDENEMVSSFPKKAVSSREQAKKKFLKVSRKFARMIKKLAE